MIMQTFSGKQFDPENPKPEDVDILDIAVSLSRVNRFAGHTYKTFCVASHCLLVTDLMKEKTWSNTPRLRLLGLLHDAAEAYTSDIPTPVKRLLSPNITEVESRIELAIYKKVGILPPTADEHAIIKAMDQWSFELECEFLRTENWSILRTVSEEKILTNGVSEYLTTFNTVSSEQAALLFLRKYGLLREELNLENK